jgi:hypothetical protein
MDRRFVITTATVLCVLAFGPRVESRREIPKAHGPDGKKKAP